MFPLEAFQSTLAKVATIFNGLKIERTAQKLRLVVAPPEVRLCQTNKYLTGFRQAQPDLPTFTAVRRKILENDSGELFPICRHIDQFTREEVINVLLTTMGQTRSVREWNGHSHSGVSVRQLSEDD